MPMYIVLDRIQPEDTIISLTRKAAEGKRGPFHPAPIKLHVFQSNRSLIEAFDFWWLRTHHERLGDSSLIPLVDGYPACTIHAVQALDIQL